MRRQPRTRDGRRSTWGQWYNSFSTQSSPNRILIRHGVWDVEGNRLQPPYDKKVDCWLLSGVPISVNDSYDDLVYKATALGNRSLLVLLTDWQQDPVRILSDRFPGYPGRAYLLVPSDIDNFESVGPDGAVLAPRPPATPRIETRSLEAPP